MLHGRAPTATELSESLAITEAELATLFDDLDRCEVGSLNTLVLGDDDNPTERLDTLASADLTVDPEHAAMREGAIASFRAAFDKLPARERRVALLLHVDDLTLRETGEILGVSESRVCQIHGKLKRGLRQQLEADEPLLLDVA